MNNNKKREKLRVVWQRRRRRWWRRRRRQAPNGKQIVINFHYLCQRCDEFIYSHFKLHGRRTMRDGQTKYDAVFNAFSNAYCIRMKNFIALTSTTHLNFGIRTRFSIAPFSILFPSSSSIFVTLCAVCESTVQCRQQIYVSWLCVCLVSIHAHQNHMLSVTRNRNRTMSIESNQFSSHRQNGNKNDDTFSSFNRLKLFISTYSHKRLNLQKQSFICTCISWNRHTSVRIVVLGAAYVSN